MDQERYNNISFGVGTRRHQHKLSTNNYGVTAPRFAKGEAGERLKGAVNYVDTDMFELESLIKGFRNSIFRKRGDDDGSTP
ncbi:hypothetical protein ACO22_06691 [Paracoccidioides brasiliensis]|uniref:Uncharacterized protein n=1 Tax=Paracoccidioides brasiliensis TaxID=121759 RepID=A0A1D2J733_PARBR|nr:hypothetical protein ACO22_06691 [Paracoccidioides brasiliensis]